ncbi:metallophosphoesterase family protein [Chryseobacterium camelliae]|uniref:metallophosphoesterase family protein n=1 Tax=Chryseobacterium camelliae TaxID=1265445 RepID=UPI00285CDA21|nr:metallophosphoesterase [Chryseobacterium camelliae]MDR6513688.1 putative MPP superfamily phosphohydrolase [Chryseobacterium camelliae]
MRIIHISDIHLSSSNYDEFSRNYIVDLLKVLQEENEKKDIDLIVITGDLVDQGGSSLSKIPGFEAIDDPYQIFEEKFIDPIKTEFGFENERFLFIAGNHDIDESDILWVDEKNMQKQEVEGNIKTLLSLTGDDADRYRARIKRFKDFEERFHRDTLQYKYSINQSTYVYEFNNQVKVGFALINDSWRCSTCKLAEPHNKLLFFGTDQIYNALPNLEGTDMKVILTHHPIESFQEREEFKRAIINKQFHLHLFGDKHQRDILYHITPTGQCIGLMARAGLNKPDEEINKWQPGFHIIDIDFEQAIISCMKYFKYSYENGVFTLDSDAAPRDGIDNTPRPLGFAKIVSQPKIDLTKLEEKTFYKP